jgi:hypothetical protein
MVVFVRKPWAIGNRDLGPSVFFGGLRFLTRPIEVGQ